MQNFIEEVKDLHRHATGAGDITWDTRAPIRRLLVLIARTTKTPGRCTRRTSRPRAYAGWSPRMWCLRREAVPAGRAPAGDPHGARSGEGTAPSV